MRLITRILPSCQSYEKPDLRDISQSRAAILKLSEPLGGIAELDTARQRSFCESATAPGVQT